MGFDKFNNTDSALDIRKKLNQGMQSSNEILALTPDINSDYIIDLTDAFTFADGLEFTFIFGTATLDTADARISIDNNITQINVVDNDDNNVNGKVVQNNKVRVVVTGSKFKIVKILEKEMITYTNLSMIGLEDADFTALTLEQGMDLLFGAMAEGSKIGIVSSAIFPIFMATMTEGNVSIFIAEREVFSLAIIGNAEYSMSGNISKILFYRSSETFKSWSEIITDDTTSISTKKSIASIGLTDASFSPTDWAGNALILFNALTASNTRVATLSTTIAASAGGGIAYPNLVDSLQLELSDTNNFWRLDISPASTEDGSSPTSSGGVNIFEVSPNNGSTYFRGYYDNSWTGFNEVITSAGGQTINGILSADTFNVNGFTFSKDSSLFNNSESHIWATDGNAGDFGTDAGHLVLEARGTAARDIIMVAGNAEVMRVQSDGKIVTSGDLTLKKTSGENFIAVDSDDSSSKLKLKQNDLDNWIVGKIGSGFNEFGIQRHNSSGVFIDTPFTIDTEGVVKVNNETVAIRTNIKSRITTQDLSNAGTGTVASSISTTRTLSKGDIIEMEVNNTFSSAWNPKVVKMVLGSSDTDPGALAQSDGWNAPFGSDINFFTFATGWSGSSLYFDNRLQVASSDITNPVDFTLYVGNVWYCGNIDD